MFAGIDSELESRRSNSLAEDAYILAKQAADAKQSMAEAEGLKVVSSSSPSLLRLGGKAFFGLIPVQFRTVALRKTVKFANTNKKNIQKYLAKMQRKVELLLDKTEREIRNLNQKISSNYYQNKLIKMVAPIIDLIAQSCSQLSDLLQSGVDLLVPEKIQRIEREIAEIEREAEEVGGMLDEFTETDLHELSMLTYGAKTPQQILDVLENYQSFKSGQGVVVSKVVAADGADGDSEKERLENELQAILIKRKLSKVLDRIEKDLGLAKSTEVVKEVSGHPDLKIKLVDKSKIGNHKVVHEIDHEHKMTVTI